MSRGVVLWPDDQTSTTVREIWNELHDHGLPSMASQPQHIPHVSLVVADALPVQPTLDAVGQVPPAPIPLIIESCGVVPGGHLLLVCTPNGSLLEEQKRVHQVAVDHADNPWSHYAPDEWLPHLTLARSLTAAQLAVALPIVLCHLPLRGTLPSGGIEDGATGDRWPTTGRS